VRRNALLLGLGVLSALVRTLSADVVFVPIPDAGGIKSANYQTTIEVANHSSSDGALNLAFVPTNTSGTGSVGGGYSFPAGRTVTYEVTKIVGGPGLLKVTSDVSGLGLGQAAFYVDRAAENAPWDLPVISSANQFTPGTVAFLEDLRRNADGVSNVEIVNLGDAATLCTIDLFDQAGTAILPGLNATVPAEGHAVSNDVLIADHVTEILGGEARVSCDQPFYAYATFVSPDFNSFRMIPPLANPPAPAGPSVIVNMPGQYFVSNSSHPNLDLPLPLVPGVSYRRVTIDFDMTIRDFTPIFTGVLGMFHAGGPRFGKTLYFGFNVRGMRGRVLGDLGQPTLEAAVKRNVAFDAGGTYHMKIIYDTPTRSVLFYATKPSGIPVMDALVGNFNWNVIDTGGAPVRVQFGIPGIADGAYYPPTGWRFSNLHIVATP